MRLHVDDFGCVPDGRVLERVTIAAGSAVLTDPDGGLRETDVGKNIAVPGAADLDATIVRLVDRKDVDSASMTAGQATLTASFTSPSERFRADLHTGHRIVVDGAGPAGQPLLTDVLEVVNPTTLRLADAASTTVAGVAATLNRPDRVGLSNHARRSVTDITVDLGDRVIDDARMTIGGRGLESETARFSRLDLDLNEDVTIQAAGLWVDFEPTGGQPPNIVAPTDIIIESNVLVHEPRGVAMAISGVRRADPARRVKFADNILLGGEVFCTDVAELTIQNNVVLVPESDRPGRILLSLERGGDSVLITGNLLISEHDETTGVINLSETGNRQVSRALVAGNLCVTPAGQGIRVTGSDDVAVEGNMLVATGACTQGVHVQSETSAVNEISVRNNEIIVKDSGSWATGILFSGVEIQHVSAVGNSMRGANRDPGEGGQDPELSERGQVPPTQVQGGVGLGRGRQDVALAPGGGSVTQT